MSPAPPGSDRPQDGANVFDLTKSASRILESVRREGAISRADLPDHTGLSQQSVHRVCEDLLHRGLLQLSAPKIQGRGKPSPRLKLNGPGAYGFGLSLDTDQASLALCDLEGKVLDHRVLDVSPNAPAQVLAATVAAFQAISKAFTLEPSRIAGLGVSMQGYRNEPGTRFVPSLPLDAWSPIDVTPFFRQTPDYPAVFTENNANLGAVAELWVGIGRVHRHFTYLSFDYGFGGGVVLNGEPFFGQSSNAGEISSLYTPEESRNRPALQSLLQELEVDGIHIGSLPELRTAYDPDWPAVSRWLDRVVPQLNHMVRAMTAILDPGAIVFGGAAPLALRKQLIAHTETRPMDRFGRKMPQPDLVVSDIDVAPSLLGAALLPIRSRLF